MTAPERLRESLRDLADAAEPADLYDGSVRRSRTIARREATVGTTAAMVALAVLASGLWRAPDRDEPAEAPLAARSPITSPAGSAPSATPSPLPTTPTASREVASSPSATRRKNRPSVVVSTPVPQSRSLADLPGQIFYEERGDKPDVVRMSPADDGDTATVLADSPSPVGVSPDGDRVAYEQDGDLLVASTRGGGPDRVATGVSTANQAPAWSPEGDRLLVGTAGPAILQVASGTLTPLPGPIEDGLHIRWSGDGSKFVYATSYCGLQVAGSSTGVAVAVAVPMLGDTQPADNPDGLAACRPTSVDATGRRVTVPLQTTGASGDDGSRTADAVVDTATGNVMRLPVAGSVVGTVFDPDGNLLVRTARGGVTKLSLFAADGTLRVQATEPAAVRGLDLLAYTR